MSDVSERFLRYVAVPTASDENSPSCPSSECQWTLARLLCEEMREMGVQNARVSEYGYVYGEIPENTKGQPAIGLIAHIDTVDGVKWDDIKPRRVRYEGGDLTINKEIGAILREKDYGFLESLRGKELIVTDGTTLLGADDKAGVAEIMTLCARLLAHPEIPHGKVLIGFTPDEEIGRGADKFDVEDFGADFAYTVDGGAINEYEEENFNAASARVTAKGFSIHPGSSKNRMRNAAKLLFRFDSLLPACETPEHTEGREGFYHLCDVKGDVDSATGVYILRDHDAEKLEAKKARMLAAADYINKEYGDKVISVEIRDSYRNMLEILQKYPEVTARARKALSACGLNPVSVAIRGGTDGARLSYMGLPCPNLGTGGYNGHGCLEMACVEDMEKMVDVLCALVRAD